MGCGFSGTRKSSFVVNPGSVSPSSPELFQQCLGEPWQYDEFLRLDLQAITPSDGSDDIVFNQGPNKATQFPQGSVDLFCDF